MEWYGDRALANLKKHVASRLDAVGEGIADQAKQNCPVETGELRRSINHKVDDKELSVSIGFDQTIGFHGYLGLFFELGTPDMPPKPILRPAMEDSAKVWKKELGR